MKNNGRIEIPENIISDVCINGAKYGPTREQMLEITMKNFAISNRSIVFEKVNGHTEDKFHPNPVLTRLVNRISRGDISFESLVNDSADKIAKDQRVLGKSYVPYIKVYQEEAIRYVAFYQLSYLEKEKDDEN